MKIMWVWHQLIVDILYMASLHIVEYPPGSSPDAGPTTPAVTAQMGKRPTSGGPVERTSHPSHTAHMVPLSTAVVCALAAEQHRRTEGPPQMGRGTAQPGPIRSADRTSQASRLLRV
jgi:hypothetical protein